jgi:hypothetical protein
MHKSPDDQNLVENECKSCNLVMILDTDNLCEFCNPKSFQSARLYKQNALFCYLDQRNDLPQPKSTDTTIENGECGKERPDRIYDLGDKILIIECDEHQHRDRPCDCEQTRMVNIAQSYGGIPVYFIRFNPDIYEPEDENKDPELIYKRHKMLGDLIRDIANKKHKHLPKSLCSVIYLYFDGWSSIAREKWQTLIDYENTNTVVVPYQV